MVSFPTAKNNKSLYPEMSGGFEISAQWRPWNYMGLIKIVDFFKVNVNILTACVGGHGTEILIGGTKEQKSLSFSENKGNQPFLVSYDNWKNNQIRFTCFIREPKVKKCHF